MATIIDSLCIEIGLDPSKFIKGSQDAGDAFKKTRESAETHGKAIEASSQKAAGSIEKIAKQALSLYAVFLGAQGITSFISQIEQADSALGRFAKSIGAAPNTIGAFDLAARSFGGSAENMNAAFDRLNTQFMELTTNGQNLPKAFYQLQAFSGQSIDYAHGRVKMMVDIAGALQRVAKTQGYAKASFLGKQLTGLDDGSISMMIKLGKDMPAYIDAKKKLAPSDDEIAKITRFQQAWEDLTQHFQKLATTIWADLSPALTKAFVGLSQWFDGITEQDEFNTAIENFKKFIEGIDWTNTMAGFGNLKDQAKAFLDVVNDIIAAIKLVTVDAPEFVSQTRTPEGRKAIADGWKKGVTTPLPDEKEDKSWGHVDSTVKGWFKSFDDFMRKDRSDWFGISQAHAEPAVHPGGKPLNSGIKVEGREVNDANPMPVKLTVGGAGGSDSGMSRALSAVLGGSTGSGAGGGSTPSGGGGRGTGGSGEAGPPGSGSFMDALASIESGNRNIYSGVDRDTMGPNTRSQGYFQIETGTWRQFGKLAGIDLAKYPRAMLAPYDIQKKVAALIPLSRFGPRTRNMLMHRYGNLNTKLPVGQLGPRNAAVPKVPVGAKASTPKSSSGGATPGSGQTSSVSHETNVGEVHVYTQATDANGIAAEIHNALRYQQLAMTANGGMA